MANNPSQPLVLADRLKRIADEQNVGGHYEGESRRERKVGNNREVVVDIFKRGVNPYALDQKAGTYFMRVSLRSMIDSRIITRFEIDIDRYSTDSELCKQARIGGGVVSGSDNEKRGARWDTEYVANQAHEAIRELLAEITKQ
jgi:hypothetical protein